MEDILDKSSPDRPETPESSGEPKSIPDRVEGVGEKGEKPASASLPPEKPSFWDRFAYPLMLVVGVVVAGGISFLVQSGSLPWFSGQSHTVAASGGPRSVPVVYINTGKIMADVIKSQVENGKMTRHEAAEMGHVIGQTIQEIAAHYASQGDLVLSRNVLAAPQENNITDSVEQIVKVRLAEDFGRSDG